MIRSLFPAVQRSGAVALSAIVGIGPMMQIGLVLGSLTTCPVSRRLLRIGLEVACRHRLRRRRAILGACAAGYALGAIPFADLAARRLGVDLRAAGSGNPGGRNAVRVLGRRRGAAVMAADVLKGVCACAVGGALAGEAGAHLGGVAAVAGHCYPAQAGFAGGLGVATSFGQCLGTFPAYAPLDLAVAVGVSRVAGRRSAAVPLAVSSGLWIAAGVLWWRRRLPNLWGPKPSPLLPLANAAAVALIGSRGALAVRGRRRSELERPL